MPKIDSLKRVLFVGPNAVRFYMTEKNSLLCFERMDGECVTFSGEEIKLVKSFIKTIGRSKK